MSENFAVGTLVFAKMKGFPYWPGVISSPSEELKKIPGAFKAGNHCIFFFGSKNYSWIEEDKLKLYKENKDKFIKTTKKTVAFKKACEEIDQFDIKGLSVESLLDDSFDNLVSTLSHSSRKSSSKVGLLDKEPEVPVKIRKTSESSFKSKTLFNESDSSTPIKEDLSLSVKGEISTHSNKTTPVKGKLSTSMKEKLSTSMKEKLSTSMKEKLSTSMKEKLSTPVKEKPTSPTEEKFSMSVEAKLSSPAKQKHSSAKTKLSSSGKAKTPSSVKVKRPSVAKAKLSVSEDKIHKSSKPEFTPRESFTVAPRPDSPPLNIEEITKTLAEKNIIPSDLNFGFLGLGLMGCGLLKNILNSKHKVSIWNRTQEKCLEFISAGANASMTPGDVIAESDISFCCVSDNAAALELVFGNCGVLAEIKPGKAYVEMSGISPDTSQKIADAITNAGGRYLEVRFQGSKEEAEEGTLGLMAAGDRSLYDDCSSCFSAFSIEQKYFPEVGNASTYYLAMQATFGSVLHGLAELFSMSEAFQMTPEEMLNYIDDQHLLSPFVVKKCRRALSGNTKPKMPLKYVKKDLRMTLEQAHENAQTLTLTALANENLKQMESLGHKESDIGALFNLFNPSTSKKI